MNKPYILGICGGSASGKTFLLSQLLQQFSPETVTLISQDNYYHPLEKQTRTPDGLVNFDHPDSLDLDRFVGDMNKLIKGETVTLQEYTFNNPNRTPQMISYRSAPIIIVEGLFIFHKEEMARLIDLKIFVDAAEHIRLARRLRRDTTERGYSTESILRDYEKFVAPMYQKFVAPARDQSDMVVMNNQHMYKAIRVIINHLQTILKSHA
ncbi:MAG: uridine kinase [Bacteroidota bacterium]